MKKFPGFGARLQKLKQLWEHFGLAQPASGKFQLGDHRKGEFEYTGEMIGFYETSLPYYGVPTLEVIPPYQPGKRLAWTFVSPCRPGVAVLPIVKIVESYYAIMIRQYRPQLFTWYMDFPRGWVPAAENKALELLKRELPGLIKHGEVDFLADLGQCFEDSGGRDSRVTLAIVGFKTDMNSVSELKDALRQESPRDLKPMIFSLEELNAAEEQGMAVQDLHSAALWYRGKKFLRNSLKMSII